MAKSKSSGSWKKERASVSTRGSRPKSNKRSRTSDTTKRSASSSATRYWRAGYTRKDGTKVKGHYVMKRQR